MVVHVDGEGEASIVEEAEATDKIWRSETEVAMEMPAGESAEAQADAAEAQEGTEVTASESADAESNEATGEETTPADTTEPSPSRGSSARESVQWTDSSENGSADPWDGAERSEADEVVPQDGAQSENETVEETTSSVSADAEPEGAYQPDLAENSPLESFPGAAVSPEGEASEETTPADAVTEPAEPADAAAEPAPAIEYGSEDDAQAAEPAAAEDALTVETEAVAAAEQTSVGFEADSFSVYAIVVTQTIETKYIDAEGETWNISVGFTKEANIPAGAKLDVSEVESEGYLPEAEAALEGGKRVTMARFFDISILDGDGREVQPEVPVTVNISLDNTAVESIEAADHVIDNSDPVAVAMHFEESDESVSVDVKETTETEEAVMFDAESFSVWGVVYTVDFYFGDYEYHLPGEGYIALSDLFGKLEIEADAAEAKDVVFSNPELVAVVKVEEDTALSQIKAELGVTEEIDIDLETDEQQTEETEEDIVIPAGTWLLISLAPFDTEEKLTVTMEDGTVYEIRVEDDATDYTVLVNDTNGGYINPTGSVNAFIEYSSGGYQFVQNVLKDSQGNVQYFQHVSGKKAGSLLAVAKSGYDFVFWLVVQSDGTMLTIKGATLGTEKMTYTNALYIPCFAPTGAKLIIRGLPQPTSAWHYTPRNVVRYVYFTYQRDDVPRYNYSTDNGGTIEWQTSFDDAENREKYNFLGWYNQNRYISKGYDIIDNGVIKHNFKLSDVTEHTILIPKYELKQEYRNYYDVWFDGTNGVYGGEAPNNTFYSRIESTGNVQGSTSVLQQVYKSNGNSGSATVTLPTTALAPQSQGDNHFELQGWYDIYNKTWYAKGATVTITTDSVFYADWMPTNYNASSASSVSSLNTNSFITTRMFDYNNLFNMDCIELDSDKTYVNMFVNSERWKMKGTAGDFVFITKQAGLGKSVMPDGRTSNNTNNETTTNGTYYSGQVSPGLLSESLKSRLFGTSDGLGKRYLGMANYLYQYDNSTGYYYYDSDKNAASYDKGGQRFYVYSYTNATDKSNGFDGDFLPYNYGDSTFTEAYGAPNYWFGMSSQIDFFLPNEAGYTDNQGVTGNRSIKGDEMVYKFAGDDDVWVFVDGQLVLDMGGVHGKVYGEINFSQGTWTVVSNGANKVNDTKGIMSYVEGTGSKQTGTLNLAEGDHKLTLYYLERGSSQSNCAIYFNLAPRYTLQFHKVDNENQNIGLKDAKFGVYMDQDCTVPADLWGTYTNIHTNEFTTGNDGYVHCTGLYAGRTYYIKELSPPPTPSGMEGEYPDMSQEVITLALAANGTPTVTATEGWSNILPEVTVSEDGTFMLYLKVKNPRKTTTEITAQKTWSLVDGKAFKRLDENSLVQDESSTVTVRLDRYYIVDDNSGQNMDDHTVQLVTQYYVNGNGKPSNSDNQGIAMYQVDTRQVPDNGSITFSISTDTPIGIRSVSATNGNLNINPYDYTTGKPFYVSGGKADLPTKADGVSVSNIQGDTVIYITFIGSADSEAELAGKIHVTNVSGGTSSSGTPRRIVKETEFTLPDDQSRVEMLRKSNGWKHTWTNLVSVDNGRRYYYYVTEIAASASVGNNNQVISDMPSFVTTYSSDGLTTGTITVHNTLKGIPVKLRKRDSVDHSIEITGGVFRLYVPDEYQKLRSNQPATAITPDSNLIDPDQMGTYNGSALTAGSASRIYYGYLPVGTYYLVEEEAPAGYVKLEHAVKIVISATGLSYDLNPDDSSDVMTTVKADGNGFYNLYIPNTRLGALKIKKTVTVNNADQTNNGQYHQFVDGAYLFSITGTNNVTKHVWIIVDNGDPVKYYIDDSLSDHYQSDWNGWEYEPECFNNTVDGWAIVNDLVPGQYTVTEVGGKYRYEQYTYQDSDQEYLGIYADYSSDVVLVKINDVSTNTNSTTLTVEPGVTTPANDSGAAASFTNNLNLGALKLKKRVTVNGQAPQGTEADGEYTFTVKGPAPSETTVATVVIKVENGVATKYKLNGAADFADIVQTGDQAGFVFVPNLCPGQYTVAETAPTNGTVLSQIVYENEANKGHQQTTVNNYAGQTTYSQTVTVEAGDNIADWKGVTFFNNRLTTTYQPKVTKGLKLKGSETDGTWPTGTSFDFNLQEQIWSEDPENPEEYLITSGEHTDAATATQENRTASFGAIEYTQPGTYHYEITETVPDDAVIWGDFRNAGAFEWFSYGSVKTYWPDRLATLTSNFVKNGIEYSAAPLALEVVVEENANHELYVKSVKYGENAAAEGNAIGEAAGAITNREVGSLAVKKIVEAHTSMPVNGNKEYTNGTYPFTVTGPSGSSDPVTYNIVITMHDGAMQSATVTKGTGSSAVAVTDGNEMQFDNKNGVVLYGLTPGEYTVTEGIPTITGVSNASMFLKGVWVIRQTKEEDGTSNGTVITEEKETAAQTGYNVTATAQSLGSQTVNVPADRSYDQHRETLIAVFENELAPNGMTIRKQVVDRNDSSQDDDEVYKAENPWQDSADYDIGDQVPYRVTGFLPQAVYKSKGSFFYQVIDEMVNLDYVANSGRMYAFVKGPTDVEGAWYDVSDVFTDYSVLKDENTNKTTVQSQYIDLKTLAGHGALVTSWGGSDTHSNKYPYGTVQTDPAQKIPDANHIQYLQFRYFATLSDNPNFGRQGQGHPEWTKNNDNSFANTGNPNAARIKYSKDNTDGYDYTDWDVNKVFTYKLSFTKQDEKGHPLTGAKFELYKDTDGDKTKYTYTRVGSEQDGTNSAVFTWEGLDDGNYLLKETQAPEGYRAMSDIAFTISAYHELLKDDPLLTGLDVVSVSPSEKYAGTDDVQTGTVAIVNIASTDGEGNVTLGTGIPNTPYPGIDIIKIDETTRGAEAPATVKFLDGAEFTISKWNGSAYSNYEPKKYNTGAEGDTDHESATVTTDASGYAAFAKVEPGEYKIVETKAPEGYNRVAKEIYIKVVYDADHNYNVVTRYARALTQESPNRTNGEQIIGTDQPSTETIGYITHQDAQADDQNPKFTVGNIPGAKLPSTGGVGTRVYTFGGLALILAALGLLVARRKRED